MTNPVGNRTRKLAMNKVSKKLMEDGIIKKAMRRPPPSNFYTVDGKRLAVCLVARLKDKQFWFGLIPNNWDTLDDKKEDSWLVLGCAKSSDTPEKVFLIPWAGIVNRIGDTRDIKGDWNIYVKQHEGMPPDKGWYIDNTPENIDITEYLM